MFTQIGAFLSSVVKAEFDFKMLGDFFNSFFGDMAANESIAGLWNTITSAISAFAVFVPFILLLLALIEVLFGKKLINMQKFIAGVVVGYCVGVHFISPLINMIFPLPDYISGIVIALVAAVLSRFIYTTLYVLAAGYSGYLISFSGAYIPFLASLTKGNLVISLIFAAVFILVSLIFRKQIEMLGTSLLGGYFISKIIIANFADYRAFAFLGELGWLAELILILLIGVLGFIVQYKTRTRY